MAPALIWEPPPKHPTHAKPPNTILPSFNARTALLSSKPGILDSIYRSSFDKTDEEPQKESQDESQDGSQDKTEDDDFQPFEEILAEVRRLNTTEENSHPTRERVQYNVGVENRESESTRQDAGRASHDNGHVGLTIPPESSRYLDLSGSSQIS